MSTPLDPDAVDELIISNVAAKGHTITEERLWTFYHSRRVRHDDALEHITQSLHGLHVKEKTMADVRPDDIQCMRFEIGFACADPEMVKELHKALQMAANEVIAKIQLVCDKNPLAEARVKPGLKPWEVLPLEGLGS